MIYHKNAPCLAKLSERSLLNKDTSEKNTYHISLDIRGTGLQFLPGDSVGILPQNDPALVSHLLELWGLDHDTTLASHLGSKVNLSRISSSLFATCLKSSPLKTDLQELLDPNNREQLLAFLSNKDLIDLWEELTPDFIPVEMLLPHLAPLLPRFYSISSSLKAHAEELHLLVALSSYTHKKGTRYGVASHFLCHLADEGSDIPLYIQPSAHFRIPQDTTHSMIMVGPGTGVAPYRAFLQERSLTNAQGNHWLFFGGRNRHSDFFYEPFWNTLVQEGTLRLSTAFSRDQEHKVYVQHKLLEEAQEVWKWLESGSYFYVCGDATKMAKDVEATLLQIIQEQGLLSPPDAKSYLKSLKHSKRYLTDVY